ncbi:hypothetical protein EDD94_3406 [Streptomyces sp. PanSC9]|nr:hypothetical protein EDD94_3406 [Streptomyces sp. PanSC9]
MRSVRTRWHAASVSGMESMESLHAATASGKRRLRVASGLAPWYAAGSPRGAGCHRPVPLAVAPERKV